MIKGKGDNQYDESKKRALAYVLSAVISLMAPFTSMADSWQKTQNQWSYVSRRKWNAAGGERFLEIR